ncbi:ubiquitin-associated (UBA)/TS-N domain-containing protein [Zea mays]|uniref:Ubiquitin-associated (UBA)/TS-N domain-containing protein n=3 Tax=Zea mays TaxID=4577 RepID=A0A1D6Q270_MAIZE|nr:ubiquitin-associated (UBA)/TS-N domain-containing protein [Zea mays]
MAGLSLLCGDCGAQLRSVEEAQAHAEATNHANFVESTEAVLNFVCSDCGKPCRSQTEVDLHTKRTGHTEFADKTAEAAKPIDLEAPLKPASEDVMDVDTSASASGEPQEMVVPEVNKEMLTDLEGMGFSTARATRVLHFSGNSTIEGAINWLSEHQEDIDIDEMPLVPANSKTEDNKPSLTPEEMKIKAQELRDRARKKKEEEERRMEREREKMLSSVMCGRTYTRRALDVRRGAERAARTQEGKERIRIGKELLEAKRIEEQNERKRMIELRKLEKEEEKRAREKIRQKLEEDKAERRRKLGLPPEDPAAAKPSAPLPVEEKKSALPVRPATKAERMRDCLRNLKQQNKDDDAKVKRAFQTLLTYIGNVAKNPDEEKFRKIRLTNATFQERVGNLHVGIEFLELCGFEKLEGNEYLFLAREKVDKAILNTAGAELNSAITNPFFGVL